MGSPDADDVTIRAKMAGGTRVTASRAVIHSSSSMWWEGPMSSGITIRNFFISHSLDISECLYFNCHLCVCILSSLKAR